MLVICRFLQTVYTGFKFVVISYRGNTLLFTGLALVLGGAAAFVKGEKGPF